MGFSFVRDPSGRVVPLASLESLAEAEAVLKRIITSEGIESGAVAARAATLLGSWLTYFYTPAGEARLRELREGLVAAWRQRFPQAPEPACLSWELLRPASGRGRSPGYENPSARLATTLRQGAGRIDWPATCRCLAWRLLLSRFWHLELELRRRRSWLPALRGVSLVVGRHRIRLLR